MGSGGIPNAERDYSHQNMRLCTKNNNEFDGEPDTALKTDAFEIVDDFEAEQ